MSEIKVPFNVRKRSGEFWPGANTIQIMTMKVSKGLERTVVAFPVRGICMRRLRRGW